MELVVFEEAEEKENRFAFFFSSSWPFFFCVEDEPIVNEGYEKGFTGSDVLLSSFFENAT